MLYILQTALELGLLYAPVALALFLSYRIWTLPISPPMGLSPWGAAVSVTVCIAGHPLGGPCRHGCQGRRQAL